MTVKMGKHETKCTCSSSSKQPSFLTLKQLESLIPDRLQTLLVFFSSLPPTFVRKFYDSKASSSYTFIALSRSFEDDVMSRDRNFFLRVSINPIYIMIRQAWHFRLRPIDLISSQLPTLATYWAAIKRIKHADNNTVVNIREAFSLCRHFNRCYHFESKGSNTLSKYLCLDRFKTVCRTYQQKLTNDYSLRSLESVNNSRSYISWNFHFEVSFLLYLLGKTFFFFPRKTQHQTNQGRNFLLFTISLLSHEWIKVGFLCKHRRLFSLANKSKFIALRNFPWMVLWWPLMSRLTECSRPAHWKYLSFVGVHRSHQQHMPYDDDGSEWRWCDGTTDDAFIGWV